MGNYFFFLVEGNGQLYQTSITISNLLEAESPILISIYWLGFHALFRMPQELAQSEFGEKVMSNILFHFKGGLLITPNLRYNIAHARGFFLTFDVNKMVRDSRILYNAARITLIRDRSKKLCQKY